MRINTKALYSNTCTWRSQCGMIQHAPAYFGDNKMKTAERILVTALDIFNQQGENNVSSVEIALELDISPGNLYYHFKGKEVIIAALFDLYQEQLRTILDAPSNQSETSLSIEDFFYYLYLIIEKNHLFRFLYRNPTDLTDKYPSVAKGFIKLMGAQERCVTELLAQFVIQKTINASAGQCNQMVEIIGLVFSQAGNYYALKGNDINDDVYLYKSLSAILFALLPYINIEPGELHRLQEAIANRGFSNED
ncbi:TetR/AcrR family transcriptional regulator [uncultured Paraglaciecola sp.]|jgi:AcrR family transcriptional regulator|uniref:TetR/AcrR family transcriptional regulator n=1 Tax=uncultured Paraglaciecola sp. TaxID=1765024 RepID=UPI0025D361B2|nr:TetR/AcrR family transcriptional regulator [uncultured Paraglaciecola sp.]